MFIRFFQANHMHYKPDRGKTEKFSTSPATQHRYQINDTVNVLVGKGNRKVHALHL